MRRRTTALILTGVLVLVSSKVFAQTPAGNLATPTGHEVNVSLAGYNYVEPQDLRISIHGIKFGGEYTGTWSLGDRHHWFAQANVRATTGSVTYDGWCSPYLITPNPASPNGYELGIGDASACSESGDSDWYVEARGLVGKDFVGHSMAWSPYAGLGYRHLSNGTAGVPGYRTDDYLYVPLGVTARTEIGSHALSGIVEFGPLLRGWQNTHNSALGGGDVPATDTAPAFTINGFTDLAFSQHSGWTLRASAKYQITRQWAIEPYYVHWNVADSPVSVGMATFTVNGVTAQQQVGFYEPHNFTNEFGVKLGFRF
jgi:hypothetical protein